MDSFDDYEHGDVLHDDGSATRELEATFYSVIYSSYKAMVDDIYWLRRDAYYTLGTINGTVLKIPRSPKETQQILKAQQEAQARFHIHRRGSVD